MESTEFFILLFFHLSFLILAFGSVLVTDLYGMLWIFDRLRFKRIVRLSGVTKKFILTGWFGMVITGIPMILMKGEVDQLMVIKIALVALVGMNGYPLHLMHEKIKEFKEDDVVPAIHIFRLSLALTVSQAGWWGAILIGFLHRHVESVINWPEQPWLYIGLLIATFLTIWGAGELFFKQKDEKEYIET